MRGFPCTCHTSQHLTSSTVPSRGAVLAAVVRDPCIQPCHRAPPISSSCLLRTTWLVMHSPGIFFSFSHVCCLVMLFYSGLRSSVLYRRPVPPPSPPFSPFSCPRNLLFPSFPSTCAYMLLDPLPNHSLSSSVPECIKILPIVS